jgi:hypothetical protein
VKFLRQHLNLGNVIIPCHPDDPGQEFISYSHHAWNPNELPPEEPMDVSKMNAAILRRMYGTDFAPKPDWNNENGKKVMQTQQIEADQKQEEENKEKESANQQQDQQEQKVQQQEEEAQQ